MKWWVLEKLLSKPQRIVELILNLLDEIGGDASVVDETVGEGVHDERRPTEKLPRPLLCRLCTSLSALQAK